MNIAKSAAAIAVFDGTAGICGLVICVLAITVGDFAIMQTAAGFYIADHIVCAQALL